MLSYPTQCAHKVHGESYKKLILLTLMQVADGKIPLSNAHSQINNLVPKSATPTIRYKLEHGFHTYTAFAEAFIKSDKQHVFEELLIAKAEDFMKDQNLGLVKKLAKVHKESLRLRMIELSDTYLTLKLSEIKPSP